MKTLPLSRFCVNLLVPVSVALGPAAALAQTAAPSAGAKTKTELVACVLELWHPEEIAVGMVQQPAVEAIQQARVALHNRVPKEKRDAVMQEIIGEGKKFIDEVTPTVRAAATKQAPLTAGKLLAEGFSEDELRQIIAMLESPVRKKFDEMSPALRRSLGEKVAAETRPVVEPKIQAMNQAVGERLRKAVTP